MCHDAEREEAICFWPKCCATFCSKANKTKTFEEGTLKPRKEGASEPACGTLQDSSIYELSPSFSGLLIMHRAFEMSRRL